FVALLAYADWVEHRTRARYALVVTTTVAALLAKPMAVTLPVTLLLLDYWPLRRWPVTSWRALVREKGWLFLLVAAPSVVTMLLQLDAGAGEFASRVPLAGRIGNALVSYPRYVGKFLWPSNLAAMYPHPIRWPTSDVLLAAVFLLVLSGLAWRCARSAPWVLM